jgi:hypothetical protein
LALVVTSPLSRVIGNFLLRIQRPQMPASLFNSEESALRWLKGFTA